MSGVVPLLKHNPSVQDPAVLEAITVQRGPLIAALVESVLDLEGGLRHQLLIGPRGMGKTHILSLVASRVGDDPRADRVVIAWLDEDPWGIRSYDKFLAAIVARVADAIGDRELGREAEDLRSSGGEEWLKGEELLRRAVGGRRLLLLVENLDEVFRRIRPEGQARFRAFLESWRQLLIFATSSQLFEGVQRHESPFYGFFAITHLDELSLDSATELLRRVAELHEDTDLREFLVTETARMRLEAIEALAGGHPRIWLLLAGCISVAAIDELVPLFLEALDELTPYYQDRLRELGDQQQEIVVLLAEAGGALSNRALSERSGIGQNQVATILRQLTERGYVRKAAVDSDMASGDERMSFWELREPLMRLCLDVKQARGKPLRMVVEFLRAWYGPRILDELVRLPKEAELAAAYAGEAFRTLEGLPTEELLRGSPDEVVARAERGLEVTPERLELKVVRATGLLAGERFEEARDCLVDLMASEEGEGAATVFGALLALAQAELGEVPSLDELLGDEEPPNPTAASVIAYAYDALDREEEALVAFARAAELSPQDKDLLESYAALAIRLERFEVAVEALEQVVEVDPNAAEAHANLGTALRRLGRLEEAIAVGRKAVRLAPESGRAYDTLANSLSAAGRYEEAMELHRKACGLEPDNAMLLTNQGVAYGRMGRHAEALKLFDRAMALDPDRTNLQANRALALRHLGQLDEALAAIGRAIELDPENAELRGNHATVLREMDRYEEAAQALEMAVELAPDDPLLHGDLGTVLRRIGRLEDAATAFRRAVELRPGDPELLTDLAITYDRMGRHEDALEPLEQAATANPESADVLRNLCAALSALNRNEEALGAIDRALALQPEDAEYNENRGIVLFRLGRTEEALAALDDAIELEPERPMLRSRRGAVLARIDRLEEALSHFTAAAEMAPDEPIHHKLRADALLRLGRLEEAEEAADRAVELNDGAPSFLFTSGVVRLARLDVEAALERFSKALSLWSEGPRRPLGQPDTLCRLLWERFEPGPRRAEAIAGFVRAYDRVGALDLLGRAAVDTIPLFVDAAVSQQEADAWVTDWKAAAEGDALEIPLSLLTAAAGWKHDRDRSHLLRLPPEQREILTELLR